LQFIENRNNPDAFEPAPTAADSGSEAANAGASQDGAYNISVNGKSYRAQVNSNATEGVQVTIDNINYIANVSDDNSLDDGSAAAVNATGEPIKSPLSGNIFQVLVQPQSTVKEGQVLIILEAMKMETEIKSPRDGVVSTVCVKQGDTVSVDDILLTL
jgi:oxaloacetate decarboxylase alpha subunit